MWGGECKGRCAVARGQTNGWARVVSDDDDDDDDEKRVERIKCLCVGSCAAVMLYQC